MCTLIINWTPDESNFISVAANRDERLDRPSEPFAKRGEGTFCPLDVRGGTWIGVNKGLFVALTNLDTELHKKGAKSRGYLVLDSLNKVFLNKGLEEVCKIDYRQYNAFNLILADGNNCVCITNDHESLKIKYLEPGLHISTGHGLDKWDVPRCCYVKNTFKDDVESLKSILSYHSDNVDYSVCVHDEEESHKTRSSCIIKGTQNIVKSDKGKAHKVFKSFEVHHLDHRPCDSNDWKVDII